MTTVAAARQPFAPIDSSRLQTLSSFKNRQNGMLLLFQSFLLPGALCFAFYI